MSEPISQRINVNGTTLIIYNNRKPDSYAYSDIFDPDNPQSGKYFPSLYSIVIKEDGSVWYVATRNENTYKVTLKPINIVKTDSTDTEVNLVSYGNDKYCLYQDTRVSPYKLVVDAKVLFYGNNLKEYQLVRYDEDGHEEIISMYFDNTDTFISSRVPMAPIGAEYQAYKFPTNCHTTTDLKEGEPILLRVYNNLGNLAAELTIYVRNGVWLNDLQSHTNPIVGLDAECLQMVGDDFYVKERQDPKHLDIRPYLTYADGSKLYLNIDNSQCFIYGLEYFVPSYPGYSQAVIIKYFLNHRESAIGNENVGNTRFLTCTKKIVVLKDRDNYSVKISVIPVFNGGTNKWELRYFLYTDDRNAVYEISDYVTLDPEWSFDGSQTKWGTEQKVIINYELQEVLNTSDPLPGTQVVYITVNNPSMFERYTLRDNNNTSIIYGSDGSLSRRPIIRYDITRDQYFIPTSVFQNQDAFIESFYRKARPFFDTRTETEAPIPTHFNIRDTSTGQQLIANPIEIEEYGTIWSIISTSPNLNGATVLVEFLQRIDNTYNILYGVPVDVRLGVFNDETN